MKQIEANKGVQGTAHKVRCPLTPDVGLRNNGLLHVQWTFHIANGKSIDRAATISKSEAKNSR